MTLIDEINEWDSNILERPFYSHDFNSIHDILKYKEEHFFREFSPTAGPVHSGFWDRLESWLENVDNEKDKKSLFEFTLNIHFVTSDDFKQLFLSAFSGPIKRWAIDLHNIDFNQQLDERLNLQLHEHTWYCSVTDMNLGEFYRVNNITGISVRPDFNTLASMGDGEAIQQYMSDNGFNQVVLLEDFVGSGTQFTGILEQGLSYFGDTPILFVPLLICPNGLNNITRDLMAYSNWKIEPVIKIDRSDSLTPETNLSGNPLEKEIVNIAKNFSRRTGGDVVDELVYGHENTGALVVLHSNTPDNTMPFIWWADNWNALFPRSARI